ncbi:polysaccharide export protein [Rudanella paleaurantiibacter]|uniref:Polysaccharide export protein n=1 Tax=Rudanella paleaurantiibacter TaxID=2614655 RepID=A0A7J5U468_9BACT|nr:MULTISPECIES: polysaccharide biosynthesis/export family protein [Rudanella]KAB7732642.1 polysaccharide export protein [Rudanella paleaurantiibacter]
MSSFSVEVSKRVFITGLFLLVWLSGCVSPKQLVYFQDISSTPDSIRLAPFSATIRPGDLLSVQVSSLNPEASAFFNPHPAQPLTAAPSTLNSTTPLPAYNGYLVAPDNTITLPLIGKVAVAGLTNVQAASQIQTRLKDYLKEPTVSLRNLNFRITVLGEVARPSLFNISNEQISLPEALGLAGDLTVYGRRDNVLVIREENGKRTSVRLDLTRRDVFQSPYYYLHPNDVVYVEPVKARVASVDRVYQITPIVLSALSFLAIIASRW